MYFFFTYERYPPFRKLDSQSFLINLFCKSRSQFAMHLHSSTEYLVGFLFVY